MDKSEEADRLYVTWAQDVRGGADPFATQSAWTVVAHESEVLKEAFVAGWNAEIAPRFEVQTFKASLI
ncbi:MAG: hypothetical protein LBO20_00360 [Bifidobacteriaceae bacterium]|nr:hypothetical protein [Bifidobacteriaceae bacterium]